MKSITQQLALFQLFSIQNPPSKEDCFALLQEYNVPEHIQGHCKTVAKIAVILGNACVRNGYPVCVATTECSALLHDIAKMYCIQNKGRHNEVGAEWMLERLKNPIIAQGILFHNYLPPEEVKIAKHLSTMLVFYADSLAEITTCVSLDARYKGFVERYGKTKEIKDHISLVRSQAFAIEAMLTQCVGEPIDALLKSHGVVLQE